jgi:hypothetical protein
MASYESLVVVPAVPRAHHHGRMADDCADVMLKWGLIAAAEDAAVFSLFRS